MFSGFQMMPFCPEQPTFPPLYRPLKALPQASPLRGSPQDASMKLLPLPGRPPIMSTSLAHMESSNHPTLQQSYHHVPKFAMSNPASSRFLLSGAPVNLHQRFLGYPTPSFTSLIPSSRPPERGDVFLNAANLGGTLPKKEFQTASPLLNGDCTPNAESSNLSYGVENPLTSLWQTTRPPAQPSTSSQSTSASSPPSQGPKTDSTSCRAVDVSGKPWAPGPSSHRDLPSQLTSTSVSSPPISEDLLICSNQDTNRRPGMSELLSCPILSHASLSTMNQPVAALVYPNMMKFGQNLQHSLTYPGQTPFEHALPDHTPGDDTQCRGNPDGPQPLLRVQPPLPQLHFNPVQPYKQSTPGKIVISHPPSNEKAQVPPPQFSNPTTTTTGGGNPSRGSTPLSVDALPRPHANGFGRNQGETNKRNSSTCPVYDMASSSTLTTSKRQVVRKFQKLTPRFAPLSAPPKAPVVLAPHPPSLATSDVRVVNNKPMSRSFMAPPSLEVTPKSRLQPYHIHQPSPGLWIPLKQHSRPLGNPKLLSQSHQHDDYSPLGEVNSLLNIPLPQNLTSHLRAPKEALLSQDPNLSPTTGYAGGSKSQEVLSLSTTTDQGYTQTKFDIITDSVPSSSADPSLKIGTSSEPNARQLITIDLKPSHGSCVNVALSSSTLDAVSTVHSSLENTAYPLKLRILPSLGTSSASSDQLLATSHRDEGPASSGGPQPPKSSSDQSCQFSNAKYNSLSRVTTLGACADSNQGQVDTERCVGLISSSSSLSLSSSNPLKSSNHSISDLGTLAGSLPPAFPRYSEAIVEKSTTNIGPAIVSASFSTERLALGTETVNTLESEETCVQVSRRKVSSSPENPLTAGLSSSFDDPSVEGTKPAASEENFCIFTATSAESHLITWPLIDTAHPSQDDSDMSLPVKEQASDLFSDTHQSWLTCDIEGACTSPKFEFREVPESSEAAILAAAADLMSCCSGTDAAEDQMEYFHGHRSLVEPSFLGEHTQMFNGSQMESFSQIDDISDDLFASAYLNVDNDHFATSDLFSQMNEVLLF